MEDFLDRYHVQKLNQHQVNYLNWPIFPKEIIEVIKILPKEKKYKTLEFDLQLKPSTRKDLTACPWPVTP